MRNNQSPTPSESGSILSAYSYRSGRNLPRPVTSNMCTSATSKTQKYLRRLIKFKQMDFEFALWQMLYLFVAPQKVFRNFGYRKETKAQFARDDPAFLVLLLASLCFTSFGFTFIFHLGIFQTLYFILYVVFVDFLLASLISASILWMFSNKFMRDGSSENVEWGYSFDVHINAQFPPLIILHFVMLIFYKVLFSQEWFIARVLGNTLWLLAIGYYSYISFLGYNSIPYLKKSRTRLILVVVPIFFLFYLITIIIGWNLNITLMNFYHYRVL
ncbi:unnamed protein product [Chironomus riparius]|uniref:Protein unc-50 homolog n=1 Tax=Chironomus riparius TaxID=315576 RepID=A0A9N9RV23_9DIPT|nr:unnamed protein product [Chironomus riparius]